MTSKDIVKTVMKLRGISGELLAQKVGLARQSSISERLRGKKGMRVDSLLSMLEAMDCELVVRSKLSDKREWVVTGEEE